MANPTPQQTCARRLQELLAMAEGQRWARQYLDGTEPSYPHQRGQLTLKHLQAHVAGAQTVGLLPDGHGGLCRFGAIDLDLPRDGETLLDLLEQLQGLQASAAERGLRTLATFSGRRGFHLVLPLAFPTAWGVVHRALRRLARDVGFEPVELFPTRGKCLKLPCGVHGATGAWSVVLPDLAGWELAALQQLAGDLQVALDAAASGQPLEPDWEGQAALLEAARPCDPQALEEAAGESTVPDLELLPEGEHPACIAALLEQGPRAEHLLNGENLNLARYAAQAGLDQEEAEALATQLWEATPEGYSRKDLGASLKNFGSSYRRALEGDSAYLFRCSDMAAGGPVEARKLVASGRCKGEACPCWPWGQGRPETTAEAPKPLSQLGDTSAPSQWKAEFPSPRNQAPATPAGGADEDPGELLTRRLWRALQHTHTQGQELRLSLVLAAAEGLPDDPHPSRPGHQVPLADVLAERELLAAALGPHGEAVLKAAALLSPAAFNGRTTEPWDGWASALAAMAPPAEDVWRAHLEHLAEVALRVEAGAAGQKLAADAAAGKVSAADALAGAALQVAQLQRTATPDLSPADDHLEALVGELLSPAPPRIPVNHPGLRKVLGGGFRPGQLVVAGGPPGCGKTTMALQVADEAAAAGIPALFISLEMTRSQLMQASLSRLSGLDGRDLVQSITPGSGEATRLAGAVKTYRALAQRLYLVEGDQLVHTPGRIQAMVGQIRHQQGLPPDAPLLVVIDYLQLLYLGVAGEDTIPEPVRVARLATALKVLARTTGATVLALSDVTKAVMEQAEAGGRLGTAVFKDSGRVLHACDTAMAVQSGTVAAQKGKGAQSLLEVALAEPGLPEARRQQLEAAMVELRHAGDTYARWTVLKNRGGQSGGEVWSIYRRHLSQYLPCLPGEAPGDLAQTLGGGGRAF
jgi:replicative DNA helicase